MNFGCRASTLSRIASQPFTLASAFGMMGKISFWTMSPGIRTLSSSMKVSSSPLVCAGPSQNRRAVTPPRSIFASRSKRTSGGRNLTFWSRSRFWADIFLKASIWAATNLVHFILLRAVSYDDRARRKRLFARSVFGMVVRGGEVKDGAFGELLLGAHDGGAVALAQSRVNHQRRAAADHNSDVRKAFQYVHMIGHTLQIVFRKQRLLELGAGDCGQQNCSREDEQESEAYARPLIRIDICVSPFRGANSACGDSILYYRGIWSLLSRVARWAGDSAIQRTSERLPARRRRNKR